MSAGAETYYQQNAASHQVPATEIPRILSGQAISLLSEGELAIRQPDSEAVQTMTDVLLACTTDVDAFLWRCRNPSQDHALDTSAAQTRKNHLAIVTAVSTELTDAATGTISMLTAEAVSPDDLSKVAVTRFPRQGVSGLLADEDGVRRTEALFVVSGRRRPGMPRVAASLLLARAVVAPGRERTAAIQWLTRRLRPTDIKGELSGAVWRDTMAAAKEASSENTPGRAHKRIYRTHGSHAYRHT